MSGSNFKNSAPALKCRIAHEDVDAPERLDRSSDHRLARCALERIAVDQHSLAAERLNLGNDGLGLCCPLTIVDRDISPGPGQLERAPAPDASPRPCHQRLPAQKLHIQVPANEFQSRTVTYL